MFDDAREEVGDDGTGIVDCSVEGIGGALAGESSGSTSGVSDD